MMKPTEVLKSEHEVILRALDCVEEMASQTELTGVLDQKNAGQAVEFLQTFADRCHHAKEENHLFRRLIDMGWPSDGGPVGVMLAEHEEGRALIRNMAEAVHKWKAGDQATLRDFTVSASGYVELLRQHIMKENNILFPMADGALRPEDQFALQVAFTKAEKED
ncbi:MAG: hemerythrin domain-containing protein, partial [Elusimicrobia bacterium]|nr:hemerythrin domain-containing protein [Elusimicrobiota bacterium]